MRKLPVKNAKKREDYRTGGFYIPPTVSFHILGTIEVICQSNDSRWHNPDPGYGEGTDEEPLD